MSKLVFAKVFGIIGGVAAVGYTGYEAVTSFRDATLAEAKDAYLSQYPNNVDQNGNPIGPEWNQFRHGYTSAKFTRLYGKGAGQLLMDINEVRAKSPPARCIMRRCIAWPDFCS